MIISQSSEESGETEGSDPGSYLDLLNTIEDGGYKAFVVYDYSQGQSGKIDTVLQLDLSIMDVGEDYPQLDYDEDRDVVEEFDWNLASSSLEEEEEEEVEDHPVSSPVATDEEVDYDYDKSTEISENVIVGEVLLNMENDDIVRDYHYVDNYERIEEALEVTMDNVYDQAMIFHIILLLGGLEQKLILSIFSVVLFCRNLSDLPGCVLCFGCPGCDNPYKETRGCH